MTSTVPGWFQVGALVVLAVLLLVDLVVVGRRPHVPSARESGTWVAGYVALALVFAGLLVVVADPGTGTDFVTGWLTEYSLSMDNLFVFVLIMTRFAVPAVHQQRVLMIGIVIALVLRGGFILLGSAVVERFVWVLLIFGAFLIWTAVGLVRGHDDDATEFHENLLVRTVRRVAPVSTDYDGVRLTTRIGGRRHLTPMLLVLITIATTDVVFAFDSIPAIFGITQDPFLVFTANIFALMGLRQLYFLLGGLLDRLVYLSYGLAAVLGFIGVSLVLDGLAGNSLPFVNGGQPVGWAPEIPTWVTLIVIVGCLGAATVASLLRSPPGAAPDDRT